jgi:hypothetical protein
LNRFNVANLKTIGSIATENYQHISAPGIMPRAGWYMRQDDGMEELILSSTAHLMTLICLLGKFYVWNHNLIKSQMIMCVLLII